MPEEFEKVLLAFFLLYYRKQFEKAQEQELKLKIFIFKEFGIT
jgi:hypothetical protein